MAERNRSTKIVATLGPASPTLGCSSAWCGGRRRGAPEFLARHRRGPPARARLVKEICRKTGRTVAIMCDLQGPKIRVGKFKDGKVTLGTGRSFVLDASCEWRHNARGSTTRSCRAMSQRARCCCWTTARSCSTSRGARRGSAHRSPWRRAVQHKGINRQGGGLTAPALTPKDIEDIRTAAKINADYVAVSFPKSGADMYMARSCCAPPAAGVPDRQDRARRGDRARRAGGHHERLRRHHGGARRPGGRGRRRDGAGAAEEDDSPGAREQQAHDHRDADDGVDDREPGADPRRGLGRRQRGAGRHRRGDAFGRIGERQVPGRDNRGDGAHLCRGEKSQPVALEQEFLDACHARRQSIAMAACSPPSTSR